MIDDQDPRAKGPSHPRDGDPSDAQPIETGVAEVQADAIDELTPPAPKSAQQPPRKRGPRKPDDWLGKKLRELYDTYEAEPLPNDLQALLDKLDGSSEAK